MAVVVNCRLQSEVLLNTVNATAAPGSGNALQQQQQHQRWKLGPQQHHSASGGNASEPFLFIGVLSIPKSRERRNAVRQTWMQDAGPDVAVRFVLYEVGTGSVSDVVQCTCQVQLALHTAAGRIARRPASAMQWQSHSLSCLR